MLFRPDSERSYLIHGIKISIPWHCPELRELSSDKKSATPGNIPKPILFVSPVTLKKIHKEIFAPICSQ